eukprot:7376166-Prymnesium_polylepis.1
MDGETWHGGQGWGGRSRQHTFLSTSSRAVGTSSAPVKRPSLLTSLHPEEPLAAAARRRR